MHDFVFLFADEIYLGTLNPMELKMKVNAPFSCDMDLKNFPFDVQHCHLLFALSSLSEQFAIWKNIQVEYRGEVSSYLHFLLIKVQ